MTKPKAVHVSLTVKAPDAGSVDYGYIQFRTDYYGFQGGECFELAGIPYRINQLNQSFDLAMGRILRSIRTVSGATTITLEIRDG